MNKEEFILWAQKLQETYHASDDVRAQLKELTLVAFVGPTGVGKTTIINHTEIPYVLSDVTREPRHGEKNGHDYYFKSNYMDILQDIKKGEYVQFVVNRNNQFYGTRASSYPKSGACSMAIIASAIPTFRTLGFKKVIPMYILPPSYVEWMRRIGQDRAGDLHERLEEARQSLPIALADPEYRFILNDTVEAASADVIKILSDEQINQHRADLARQTAELLIGRLGEY